MRFDRRDAMSPAPRHRCQAGLAGLLCFVFGFLCVAALQAQTVRPQLTATRSVSGQFVVFAPRAEPPSRLALMLTTNHAFVRLDPTLLPASCERIKQLLWHDLGAAASWRGKIFLALHPVEAADEPITLISQQFKDGWQYRLELPEVVDRTRYVRAMVQVLLLEMANRGATDHGAEIPTWLVEGFTRDLRASSEMEIILPPPKAHSSGMLITMTDVDIKMDSLDNPLSQAHQQLRARSPLTFEELSWPGTDQFEGNAGELYACSAQLFVTKLLRLNNGRACLRAMLQALPQHYNWQLAFLQSFREHFQRPLDVEKWWTLQVAHFTGRDFSQAWAADESWQKLDQAVRTSIQVRTGTNELPLRAEARLQDLLRQCEPDQQVPALQAKLRELDALRPRLATNLVGLVDGYRVAIGTYLQNRDKSGLIPFRKQAVQRHATEELLKQLDALDARRKALAEPPGLAAAKP